MLTLKKKKERSEEQYNYFKNYLRLFRTNMKKTIEV